MNTTALIEIIGRPIRDGIIAGRHGDALLTENRWLVFDPCYLPKETLSDTERMEIGGADKYNKARKWFASTFRGWPCFCRATSDGSGPFGLSVDSGFLLAVPANLFPEIEANLTNACPTATEEPATI